jgi:hypothetical protein
MMLLNTTPHPFITFVQIMPITHVVISCIVAAAVMMSQRDSIVTTLTSLLPAIKHFMLKKQLTKEAGERHLYLCIFWHTTCTVLLPRNRDSYESNSEIHNINTRFSLDLHTSTANLTTFQKGHFYFGIKVFNHLPTSIKNTSHDINQFGSI